MFLNERNEDAHITMGRLVELVNDQEESFGGVDEEVFVDDDEDIQYNLSGFSSRLESGFSSRVESSTGLSLKDISTHSKTLDGRSGRSVNVQEGNCVSFDDEVCVDDDEACLYNLSCFSSRLQSSTGLFLEEIDTGSNIIDGDLNGENEEEGGITPSSLESNNDAS